MNKSIKFLILVICLIAVVAAIGFTLYTNAGDSETAKALITASLGEEHLDKDLVKTVAEDLKMLEKANLASDVEELSISEDGTITYIIPIEGDLRDEINVRKEANGDTVLDIQEGDLYNELTITRSGKLLLNGKELVE